MQEDSAAGVQLARWVRFGVVFLVVLVGSAVFYSLREIFLPLIVSLIIAYLLNPFVLALEARAVSRKAAVSLLTALSTAVGVGFAWLITPIFTNELTELRRILPGKLLAAKTSLMSREQALARDHPILRDRNIVADLFGKVEEHLSGASTAFPDWLASHSAALVMVLLIPFFVFFFLRDGEAWLKKIFTTLPARSVETVLSLVTEFNTALGNYLRSLIVDAILVGSLIGVGLLAVGLDYAIVIGIISGVGNFIPYLGPVLGTILAVVAAVLGGGGGLLVKALIVVGAVKLLDDWIFQPLIVGHGTDVHPVLVVVSVFIGGHVLGIVGMVIAVPLTAIVQVTLRIAMERYRFSHDLRGGMPLPAPRVIV